MIKQDELVKVLRSTAEIMENPVKVTVQVAADMLGERPHKYPDNDDLKACVKAYRLLQTCSLINSRVDDQQRDLLVRLTDVVANYGKELKKEKERAQEGRYNYQRKFWENFESARQQSYDRYYGGSFKDFNFDKDFNFEGNNRRSNRYQRQERPNLNKRETYLLVLGLTEGFTQEQLKKAYLAKMREHHPDVGGSEEKAKMVNEAYSYFKG